MNWKFDFSPETSAGLYVSYLLQCARVQDASLRQHQACRRRLTHDGRCVLSMKSMS